MNKEVSYYYEMYLQHDCRLSSPNAWNGQRGTSSNCHQDTDTKHWKFQNSPGNKCDKTSKLCLQFLQNYISLKMHCCPANQLLESGLLCYTNPSVHNSYYFILSALKCVVLSICSQNSFIVLFISKHIFSAVSSADLHTNSYRSLFKTLISWSKPKRCDYCY